MKSEILPWAQMKRIGWAKFILIEDYDIEIDGIKFHIIKRDKPYNGRSFIIRDGIMRPAALLHDVICDARGKLDPLVCSKTLWTPYEASDLYYRVCTLYGVADWRRDLDFKVIRMHDILIKDWS